MLSARGVAYRLESGDLWIEFSPTEKPAIPEKEFLRDVCRELATRNLGLHVSNKGIHVVDVAQATEIDPYKGAGYSR